MVSSRILELSAMNDQQLLVELGSQLEAEVPGIKPLSVTEKIALATAWLARQRSRFASTVCIDPNVITFMTNPTTRSRVDLIAAVADLLAAMGNVVTPTTVAVLLVRQGLDELCGASRKEW